MYRTRKEDIEIKAAYKIKACKERIAYHVKNGEFDPYEILVGNETKSMKLYRIDLEFLHDLEELIDRHDRDSRKCI